MKTNLLFLSVIIGMMVAVTSCGKKGCTDPNSENYCEKCKGDDGSCQYEGKVLFWWDKTTSDSMQAHGVIKLEIFGQVPHTAPTSWSCVLCEDDYAVLDTRNPSSYYWSQEPAWGATGILSHSASLKGSVTYEISYGINAYSSTGMLPPYTLNNGNGKIQYEGGKCIAIKLTWL